jgi:hypothetical protein
MNHRCIQHSRSRLRPAANRGPYAVKRRSYPSHLGSGRDASSRNAASIVNAARTMKTGGTIRAAGCLHRPRPLHHTTSENHTLHDLQRLFCNKVRRSYRPSSPSGRSPFISQTAHSLARIHWLVPHDRSTSLQPIACITILELTRWRRITERTQRMMRLLPAFRIFTFQLART